LFSNALSRSFIDVIWYPPFQREHPIKMCMHPAPNKMQLCLQER
jgi:hypothetical protein